MTRILSLYVSYMATAIVGMGLAGLFLGALYAPGPESYLLAATAAVFVSVLSIAGAFFYWVFPQLVERLNRYEGRENRSPLELVAEALGTARFMRRGD